MAQTLTPPPMQLAAVRRGVRRLPGRAGTTSGRRTPDWPHLDEAVELAARFAAATAGNTLVHTDVRDDNLVGRRGPGLPVRLELAGARGRLDRHRLPARLTAHGDGLDADALLARARLTRTVDPDSIDSLLALLCGYFLARRDEPGAALLALAAGAPVWYAEVTWSWLAQRRGWT